MGSLFKSKENKSTTSTELPKWVKKIHEDYAGDLGGIRDKASELFESGGVGNIADMPPEWQEALGQIKGSGEGWQEMLDMAKGGLGQDYESQYTDDVVDTTLAGMQRQAQRDALARQGQAAAVGGTSNTRAAVGDAVAENLSGMSMAEMEAKLRDEGFRFGSEMGMKDRDQMLDIGQQELTGGLQLGGAIGGIGDQFFDYEQSKLDQDQNGLSWLSGMFSQANPLGAGAGTGTSTQTTPGASTFSQILGAGTSIAGAFLSDERTKEDIVSMEHGLDALKDVTPATYEYKEGMPTDKKGRTAGLMAQDLEHIPGAVEMGSDGYRRVDPYPVMATVVQAVKELDARTRES